MSEVVTGTTDDSRTTTLRKRNVAALRVSEKRSIDLDGLHRFAVSGSGRTTPHALRLRGVPSSRARFCTYGRRSRLRSPQANRGGVRNRLPQIDHVSDLVSSRLDRFPGPNASRAPPDMVWPVLGTCRAHPLTRRPQMTPSRSCAPERATKPLAQPPAPSLRLLSCSCQARLDRSRR
ncbi:hypothetical protein BV20DRAFT_321148 [Pilatotrama ljubarskyi]|nr:hypothetical protein BV20DRAFT_321148 [Pilatotrama ljubarskyi]